MYFYHAHAVAFGGRIGSTPLNVEQGSCALAVTGGISSANVSNFKFKDIAVKSAQSSVSGEETTLASGPDTYVTKASVVLEGLNIKDVLKADKIVGNVDSTYTARDNEAVVKVSGSIEGLSIKGNKVPIQLSDAMATRYTTYGSMRVAFQNNFSQQFMNSLTGFGIPKPVSTAPRSKDLDAAYQAYTEQAQLSDLKSAVVCSLLQDVNSLPEGANRWGPAINVPEFGNIYLGEVIVWPWMRCLTMFRVELVGPDNMAQGSLSGGCVGANGTGFPPGSSAGNW